jgi:hypothetical protein
MMQVCTNGSVCQLPLISRRRQYHTPRYSRSSAYLSAAGSLRHNTRHLLGKKRYGHRATRWTRGARNFKPVFLFLSSHTTSFLFSFKARFVSIWVGCFAYMSVPALLPFPSLAMSSYHPPSVMFCVWLSKAPMSCFRSSGGGDGVSCIFSDSWRGTRFSEAGGSEAMDGSGCGFPCMILGCWGADAKVVRTRPHQTFYLCLF